MGADHIPPEPIARDSAEVGSGEPGGTLATPRPSFLPPSSIPIPGLGVSTGEASWLGRPVDEVLRAQAAVAGIDGDNPDDVITLTPGAVATADAMRRFAEESQRLGGDVVGRLAGPYGEWAENPVFGPNARMVRLRGGGELDEGRLAAAERVDVEVTGQPYDVPLLDRVGGRSETWHASAAVLINRARWPGVVWANLLGLGPALIAALPGSGPMVPARVALAALRAGSMDPGALGLQLVRRGRDVKVHASAVVEGSWLLDGARVDAGAVVRHSIVGPGAVVEAQALCIGSVLGPGALLQRRGFATFGSLDRESVCGGTLQLGYVGVQAQLKVGAILLDQALDDQVLAKVDGRLVPVPFGLLGAALGAGAVVGAGVCVAAGRLVSPRSQIVAGRDQVLTHPQVDAPGRFRVRDGRLEPC